MGNPNTKVERVPLEPLMLLSMLLCPNMAWTMGAPIMVLSMLFSELAVIG